MDWARAKSIILFLLIAFNIFLLINVYGYVRDQGIAVETIQNAEKILESRGIRLECSIPRYNKDTPKLILGNERADNVISNIDEKPSDKIDLKRKNAVETYVHDYLVKKKLVDSSYILDEKRVNSDGSIYLSYLEKYKGFLVFDNYTRVTVTDNGITAIVMQKRQITGLSATKTSNIATAYQVLLGNYDGSIAATITSIDIGYKETGIEDLNGMESSEQFPAWRVKTKEATEPRYFRITDGKEIK